MNATTDSLTSSPRPTVAEALGLLKRMKSCPEFVPSSSCGSAVCLVGRGRNGRVYHGDCFACLRGQDARSAFGQPAPADDALAGPVSLPTALV